MSRRGNPNWLKAYVSAPCRLSGFEQQVEALGPFRFTGGCRPVQHEFRAAYSPEEGAEVAATIHEAAETRACIPRKSCYRDGVFT
jgi:hypothetical protein